MAGAVTLDAGGRDLRVSSPDRVIFEATERTPDITKLQVVEYYLAVEEGILRALMNRPTALERWPSGVREGYRLGTGRDKSEAFYQKRVPQGAPDFVDSAPISFPSGRTAREVMPTEIATVAWCAQMGTLTFHPWPVRVDDVDRPDELRIDLDPQPGTDFSDAASVAMVARDLLTELGLVGVPKTSGNRGLHLYIRLVPEWDFVDVRHAAIAFGRELARRREGVTTAWWKEERGARIFVDYNQNSRDRTIASAYSVRPLLGAPVSTPLHWDEVCDTDPRDHTLVSVPERLREHGDLMAALDDNPGRLDTLLDLWRADVERGEGELNYPPDYPKMPGEPPRVQPSKKNPANWK